MNVEVLGDDIYYGACANTLFRKQYRRAFAKSNRRITSRFGDDEMMGLDFSSVGKGLLDFGKGVVKAVSSPGGKAVAGAALTVVAERLTPTQKAQVAKAQEIAGISPQTLTGNQNQILIRDERQPDGFTKNLPLILGGVGLFAALSLVVLKKRQ